MTAFCDFLEGCVAEANGLAVLAKLDCERAVPQLLPTGQLIDAVAKAEAGVLTFNSAEFERCLERISDECIPIDQQLCPEAFEGAVAVEGDCASSYECAGEATCEFEGQCPGTCVAKRAPGQDCGADIECASNGKDWGECNADNNTCRSVEVVSLGKEGDDCGLASALGNNLGLALCEKGLFCDSEGSGKCVMPVPAGGDCSEIAACAPGSSCVEGTCLSLSFVTAAGNGCNAITAPCDPQAGLRCDGGFCVSVSDGSNGSECALTPLGSLYCQEGLVCRQGTGLNPPQCLPPGAEDDPCNNHIQCASGTCDEGSCAASYCGGAAAQQI